MFRGLRNSIAKIQTASGRLDSLETRQQQVMVNQGILLANLNTLKTVRTIQDTEFSVFSQFGEDGIIQYLTQNLEIRHKTFIEFGVEDFVESNCRFCMIKDNWSGFVIDGSDDKVGKIKSWPGFWKYDLSACAAFIDRDNINGLLDQSGFDRDLGILSIDIDGMDFWIAKALQAWQPRILIMEYNAVLGIDRTIVVPYDAGFQRQKAHYSGLYYGASLKALQRLATAWGYDIVGTTSAGNNAFFVRRDLLNAHVKAVDLDQAYSPSQFRQSRDADGKLTYLRGKDCLAAIKGLPVYDVDADALTTI